MGGLLIVNSPHDVSTDRTRSSGTRGVEKEGVEVIEAVPVVQQVKEVQTEAPTEDVEAEEDSNVAKVIPKEISLKFSVCFSTV